MNLNDLKYQNKVLVIGKSTCPHTNAVDQMFTMSSIPFKRINLDLIEDKQADLLRKDLTAETKQTTVPYVYINGQFVGGEDATKKARDDGTLMDRLRGAGIKFDDTLLQEQKLQKQTTA